jgi:hypothetical protein
VLKKSPPNGVPSLPFYRSREGPEVHEREKEEKKKEKKQRRREPRSYIVLLLRQAGPAGGVDDGEDGFTS